ncbi:MAG: ABC transporter ATP-binding protein [Chloroflexi bacterium]|nr:ABC transporter ATP-binding protein [Chloroflexota bacterium]
MDNHTLIRIESVSKHYGPPRDGVLALRDVSLDVRAGEFLSIIGPSGCGKSTLLRLVGDLLAPNEGRILIDGRTPAQARRARETAIVFQSPTLMEWRSIASNIQLPLEILKLAHAERERRAAELLDLIRLRDFGARYPHELSSGMQQQVAIARALAYRPAILLMDEPFGALDEMTRERLGRELLDIWDRTRVTILFVTHSVGEAVMLSDRVAVLTPRPGQIERVIEVDLPRPRTVDLREAPRYAELVRAVRAALRLNGNGRK